MTHTAQRIKTLRKQAGLSQQELADKIGVLRETISNWERGVSRTNVENIERIATFFQVPVSDLLGIQIPVDTVQK
ncbi:helix-turn-helix transcriptional regulator [Streptococcus suis]|uniref:helix-turn-helix domain-containing protein n=1 Tax=Streptococcus suis TaxID=1307 RepID=UPI0028C3FB3C|nr:helix-turn-helix transcriptional regulator [Streptococcus suis]WNO83030.1 helix-turn-helix transcriptional regulator [Streptococcus suis]